VGTISDTNYQGSTSNTLVIDKGAPAITWATPAAIPYGTALSATQLNANSTVAGTFVYTPAAGTVLSAGSQNLSVTFTPTDLGDYTTATATVTLMVNKTTPTITWATPATIPYGTALSATQLNASSTVAGDVRLHSDSRNRAVGGFAEPFGNFLRRLTWATIRQLQRPSR